MKDFNINANDLWQIGFDNINAGYHGKDLVNACEKDIIELLQSQHKNIAVSVVFVGKTNMVVCVVVDRDIVFHNSLDLNY